MSQTKIESFCPTLRNENEILADKNAKMESRDADARLTSVDYFAKSLSDPSDLLF